MLANVKPQVPGKPERPWVLKQAWGRWSCPGRSSFLQASRSQGMGRWLDLPRPLRMLELDLLSSCKDA